MKKKAVIMTIALLCAVAQGANADTWDGQTYKSIFLPANGFYNEKNHCQSICLYYWSSDYNKTKDLLEVYNGYFYAYILEVAYGNNQFYWWRPETMERYRGLGVRAVCP